MSYSSALSLSGTFLSNATQSKSNVLALTPWLFSPICRVEFGARFVSVAGKQIKLQIWDTVSCLSIYRSDRQWSFVISGTTPHHTTPPSFEIAWGVTRRYFIWYNLIRPDRNHSEASPGATTEVLLEHCSVCPHHAAFLFVVFLLMLLWLCLLFLSATCPTNVVCTTSLSQVH